MKPNKPHLLNGLVLLGGHSNRMGRDKALLNYHGSRQGHYCHTLLALFCEQVYLSCRSEQLAVPEFKRAFGALPCIPDAFPAIGPLAGILSAMQSHPESAWLVLACDMPDVDSSLIKRLVEARNPDKFATVFGYSAVERDKLFVEPMCAIYEPACLPRFLQAYHQGHTGLQALLRSFHAEAQLEVLPEPMSLPGGQSFLQSVNTPEEASHWRKP